MRVLAAVLTVAALFVACSDDTTEPVESDCPTDVTISVSGDSLLEITWDPPCPVSKLMVELATGSFPGNVYALEWFIRADENPITQPVTFGVVPEGAVELRPARYFDGSSAYHVRLIHDALEGDQLVGHWGAGRPGQPPRIPPGRVVFPLIGLVLVPEPGTPDVMAFLGLALEPVGDWRGLTDPGEIERVLNVRPVIVQGVLRDAQGLSILVRYDDFFAADLPELQEFFSVVWDAGAAP